MKTKFLDEGDFQDFIIDYLTTHNGFTERRFRKDDDPSWRRDMAIDKDILLSFLEDSQPDTVAALRKIFKGNYEKTILASINAAIMGDGGLLYALKHPIDVANHKLTLLYRKPEHPKVVEQMKLYGKNVFSVAKEVWASDKERIDLVVFVNGIAIMSFELKCSVSGQTYRDAIEQYRKDRDPDTRLFKELGGCLVNFAMDLDEVYMTTRLARGKTAFLPFNRGSGKGISAGAGNDPVPGKFAVSYLWEKVLTKDTIVELVMKFLFVDPKKHATVFPRYHQLDCVRKLLDDVRENATATNYLIEHSAGSGKTNTIAWLAHRLASLHDEDGRSIDDNVIVVTDRVVVDRQLQQAITNIEHKDGLVRVLDERCTSADLAKALNGNTKIVATTIQKFPYVIEKVKDLQGKRFGVIIDEAHSSTTGKDMIAVTKTLGGKISDDADAEEIVRETLRRHGKQGNVSMFAFTATPKAETLELFGTPNEQGKKEAFHLYSMKQAIEEGFILNVLENYTTYSTHYTIEKKIEDDPFYRERRAKNYIRRFAVEHPENIRQRTEIIIRHFLDKVEGCLDHESKAMVVCKSRQEAVRYHEAFRTYLRENGLAHGMKALVAFSGSVKMKGHEYTEPGINGVPEKDLPKEFDKPGFRFLIVANKYQTGFDQDKLCAMYVLKSLGGVAAVQTLSRLNRICVGKDGQRLDKRIFVLDFVNTIDDVKKAFAPYFTTTILASSVTPRRLYGKLVEIEAFGVLDDDSVQEVWEKIARVHQLKRKLGEQANGRIAVLQQEIVHELDKAKERFDRLDDEKRDDFKAACRTFVKWYGFIVQISQLSDEALYKKYRFIDLLLPHIDEGPIEGPPDLRKKIEARDFEQVKTGETQAPDVTPKPEISHKEDKSRTKVQDLEERLSKIIEDINRRYAKRFRPAVVSKDVVKIRDLLLGSAKLATAAKANDFKSFKIPLHESGIEAIADCFESSQEFYQLLLDRDEAARAVLESISREVYETLRARASEYRVEPPAVPEAAGDPGSYAGEPLGRPKKKGR